LLILPAWIAIAAMAVMHLPSTFETEAGELGSLLPKSSEALEVEREAIETFGLPLLSRTIYINIDIIPACPGSHMPSAPHAWGQVFRRPNWRRAPERLSRP